MKKQIYFNTEVFGRAQKNATTILNLFNELQRLIKENTGVRASINDIHLILTWQGHKNIIVRARDNYRADLEGISNPATRFAAKEAEKDYLMQVDEYLNTLPPVFASRLPYYQISDVSLNTTAIIKDDGEKITINVDEIERIRERLTIYITSESQDEFYNLMQLAADALRNAVLFAYEHGTRHLQSNIMPEYPMRSVQNHITSHIVGEDIRVNPGCISLIS